MKVARLLVVALMVVALIFLVVGLVQNLVAGGPLSNTANSLVSISLALFIGALVLFWGKSRRK